MRNSVQWWSNRYLVLVVLYLTNILDAVYLCLTIFCSCFAEMQVEQAQGGLESLNLSQNTINQLRDNFIAIEKYGIEGELLVNGIIFCMFMFLVFELYARISVKVGI